MQANELALEGARAEHSVGTRTVLDVLNAEQELLNSQVALVTARRDAYVAGFQLLNAMGQAEAQRPRARRRAALRSARQLSPRRRQLERLGQRPHHAPVATRTVTPQELPANPIVAPNLVPMQTNPAVPRPLQINTMPPPLPPTRPSNQEPTPGVTQPPQ